MLQYIQRGRTGMQPKQYALPPQSILDIAFKYNEQDYNLHINTSGGIISLYEIKNNKQNTIPIFIKTL